MLDVRAGYANIKKLREGELLQLEASRTSGVIQIKAIRIHDNFTDILAAEP